MKKSKHVLKLQSLLQVFKLSLINLRHTCLVGVEWMLVLSSVARLVLVPEPVSACVLVCVCGRSSALSERIKLHEKAGLA